MNPRSEGRAMGIRKGIMGIHGARVLLTESSVTATWPESGRRYLVDPMLQQLGIKRSAE